MPAFILERLPNDPVLLLTLHADYSAVRDLPKSNPAVFDKLETASEPVFYVIDTRQVSFTIEDLIQAASTTSRGNQSTFNHPNVRGVIIITSDDAVKMAIRGLDSEAFGYVKVSVASTLDEALEQVRGA